MTASTVVPLYFMLMAQSHLLAVPTSTCVGWPWLGCILNIKQTDSNRFYWAGKIMFLSMHVAASIIFSTPNGDWDSLWNVGYELRFKIWMLMFLFHVCVHYLPCTCWPNDL